MSTQAQPSRTERSASTREKIIRVAVRLFAERGIEGVSLNDINKAAGQRNKNATHYHFGSKEGLLQAIIDQYEPAMAGPRDALLDQFEAQGELKLRQVVHALVRPMAALLSDPDGGADFVRFNGHLVITHTMAAMHLQAPGFRITSVERIAAALDRLLGQLSPSLKFQRGILLGVFLTHALAEHSRLCDQPGKGHKLRPDTELFVANLEDCLVAALSAPPSETTRALL